jgi:hypothetical protein
MVSSDGGRRWQERRPPAGVFGLAIDPSDDSRTVVSTEKSLFVSPDEGEGWRPLSDQLAGLLAWPAKDRLYLVDGQGQFFVSSDAGRNWQTQGGIGGQPAAFIAHGRGRAHGAPSGQRPPPGTPLTRCLAHHQREQPQAASDEHVMLCHRLPLRLVRRPED